MSKQLSAYDRVAVLMAIEEKIFRACELLRGQSDAAPLNTGMREKLKEAKDQLLKESPNLVLNHLIRGHSDTVDHGHIDKKVTKKFGDSVIADSESDSIFIYCTGTAKDRVLAYVRKFKDTEVDLMERDEDPMIAGLSTWDDAQRWVEQSGLQDHVVVDEPIKAEINRRIDLLIDRKMKKCNDAIAEMKAKMQVL